MMTELAVFTLFLGVILWLVSRPLGEPFRSYRRQDRRVISALKMAQRQGVDPYDSHASQGQAYARLAKLQGGK